MAKTKAPSGLTIARSSMRFVCTWKIADEDYGEGLQWQYRTNLTKAGTWEPVVKLGVKTTTRTISLLANTYYPNTKKYLTTVSFRVRGKRKRVTNTKTKKVTTYDWSDWARKDYTVNVPNVPSLLAELDDEQDNVTKFTWNTTVNTDDSRPFTNLEWQTVLIKECKQTDGSKVSWKTTTLGWGTGVASRNSSATRVEDSVILAKNSYTRWFRVRARGPRGASAWRYTKHVYAMPWCPKSINKAVKEGSLNWIRVNWTADQSAAHPIDVTMIDWAIDIPRSGRAAPADPSWTTARTLRDTGGQDEVLFLVDQQLGVDECLWIRVAVQHDRNWRATGARLVMSGNLSAPTDLSVDADDSTYRATITARNNSSVPDSRLAVVLRRTGAADVVVGVTSTGAGEKTITVQCPNWSGSSAVSFGVYAFQGTATGTTSGGVTTYAVTPNMKSGTVWAGGSVPVAPAQVTAAATDTEGEVMLTWNWSWTKANRAEISWSQNPNAWESTEEPQTYMITHLHVPKWRVSGLETGAVWYFRIRLAQQTGDEITYGPYSDVMQVDLSSAPSAPVLSLSSAVVAAGDTFTASWVYVSNDNTQQAYAEICEAEVDLETEKDGDRRVVISESITYGTALAHTATAQHIVFEVPKSWETGSEHFLCVRVKSASGRVSEWSDPVAIAIAEPVTCEITQTSLENIATKNKIVYPFAETSKTYGGITFTDNGDGTITANGRATTSTAFTLCSQSAWRDLPAGTYTLTGCPTDGITGTAYISAEIRDGDRVIGIQDYGEGVTRTCESTVKLGEHGIIINIISGTVLENAVFCPMFRSAYEDEEFEMYSPEMALTVMPLTATITGAGAGGKTSLIIERAADYHMIRPNGIDRDGYEGETIALIHQDGEDQIAIGMDELIGLFDDGAPYRMIATVEDGLGQSDSDEIRFTVHWDHQAEIPEATARMENGATVITVIAPQGAASGDVCDIYRITSDIPEQIIQGGEFGVPYVDPYPAIGAGYGHRVVHRTVNGDYITADNQPAWTDLNDEEGDVLDEYSIIIDFDGNQVILEYDITLDNQWTKDFKRTAYLGGSQEGDWNPAVERKATYTVKLIAGEDDEKIRVMRELADFAGICHIRTPEGSSYSADIQVSERKEYSDWETVSYTLTVTRVDAEELDGIPYSEWIADEME